MPVPVFFSFIQSLTANSSSRHFLQFRTRPRENILRLPAHRTGFVFQYYFSWEFREQRTTEKDRVRNTSTRAGTCSAYTNREVQTLTGSWVAFPERKLPIRRGAGAQHGASVVAETSLQSITLEKLRGTK